MSLRSIRNALFVLTASGCLLASNGCFDSTQLQSVVTSATQSLIFSIINLFVSSAVSSLTGGT